jgi:hydrogenase nickel incorporation protein HypB
MRINVIQSVLKANDAVAAVNRARMKAAGVLTLNLMSAPGSGKTSLLEATIPALAPRQACGVLVGDLETARDAERLQPFAVETTQINTGTGCHLSAAQVSEGLDTLDLEKLSYLFIENVGNMVCPAAFDLGEHLKIVLLSVPEGDDKVAKYPTLFQQADAILLTKVDLIGVLDFNRQRVEDDLARINTRAKRIDLSVRTGQGLSEWLAWLQDQRDQLIIRGK